MGEDNIIRYAYVAPMRTTRVSDLSSSWLPVATRDTLAMYRWYDLYRLFTHNY